MFVLLQRLFLQRVARVGRPRGGRFWVIWLLCGGLLAGGNIGAQEAVVKEYQIKAAYLYNFAKFVDWPAQSFTNAEAPLVIGVWGENPFGGELEAIAQKHQINGRPIVIRYVTSRQEAAGAHLLFFGATEDPRVAGELAALNGARVLTVGESEPFATAGGMIHFVREADKVRFEINVLAAERQGLKISAQLLKLARTVQRQP